MAFWFNETGARWLLSDWTWRMAWRDARPHRGRFLALAACLSIGVAALSAVAGFRAGLQRVIDDQSKTLLGADLAISSGEPFSPRAESLFKSLGGEQARETVFSSMAYFPKSGGTRLAQVRAVDSNYPFYGRLETQPPSAAAQYQNRGEALAEQTLLAQFNAHAGDEIRIGRWSGKIAGSLQKVPGENLVWGAIAPRVYIPRAILERTGLLKPGSLVQYRVFFKFPRRLEIETLTGKIGPQIRELGLNYETVPTRRRRLGRAFDHWQAFLSLAGLFALFLGAVGIGSALQAHLKQKLAAIATLRCLGATAVQAQAIFLAQAIVMGAGGSVLGVLLGLLLQKILPVLLGQFLPAPVGFSMALGPALEAILIGTALAVGFALLALHRARQVQALAVLRAAPLQGRLRADPLDVLGLTLALASLALLGWMERIPANLLASFSGGLAGFLLLLAALARLVIWLARRARNQPWPLAWRHGLANLHRPGQRTASILAALALGAGLLGATRLVQRNLVRAILPAHRGLQPNLVLFDIQPDQVEPLNQLITESRLPILRQVPMVTMRLSTVNHQPVSELLKGKAGRRSSWALRHQFRSTFRDQMVDSEQIVAGNWRARVPPGTSPVPVSLEESIAGELGVGLGDQLDFDVQGVAIATQVASLRKVDWRRFAPNFFVVFPKGVLEDAPAFHVLLTRSPSSQATAALQRRLAARFPNISSIDLTLILRTIDSVIDQVAFVIRFMAGLVAGTGLAVLLATLWMTRLQRRQEAVLFRTLGSSAGQILRIQAAEYFLIGLFSAGLALLLAISAGWALCRFLFHIPFQPDWPLGLILLGALPLLTLATGALVSRGITRQPPLEILRFEGW